MDTVSIVALLLIPQVGRRTVQRVLSVLGGETSRSAADLHGMLSAVEQAFPHGRVPTIEQLSSALDRATALIGQARGLGIAVLGAGDEAFPESLRAIPDPPVVLYARGEVGVLVGHRAVAIVGTREPTPWGVRAARGLGRAMGRRDSVVVSGMAVGIDVAAHEGCLHVGGRTVAVLPHGLDIVDPARHAPLAQRIVAGGGCLISEYPPGEPAHPYHRVERDRLQSGLSVAVVVVESESDGGAMHTARFAIEQRRGLGCVVPPPDLVDHPASSGTRQLLAEGTATGITDTPSLHTFLSHVAMTASTVQRFFERRTAAGVTATEGTDTVAASAFPPRRVESSESEQLVLPFES